MIAPSDVSTTLGQTLSAEQQARYAEGAIIVTDPRFVRDGRVRVSTWRAEDVAAGRLPSQQFRAAPDAPAAADPVRSEWRPAIVIDAPHQPISVAVSPLTASQFALPVNSATLYASFPGPVSTEARDRLVEAASQAGTARFSLWAAFEDGPPSPLSWALPILGGVSVLVLGASGVALGLARFERRPDDATLAAIGGTPALRRRVSLWQGLVIAGFGTVAGSVAGVLPVVGTALQSSGRLHTGDVPWWLLAAFAIGLPLVIAITNALVPPRHPDLTRRTAIA